MKISKAFRGVCAHACVCMWSSLKLEWVNRTHILVCLCHVVSVIDMTAPLKGNISLLLLLLCSLTRHEI